MQRVVRVVLLLALGPLACSCDFCYDDGQCDPYTWGERFPSCHPLLGKHHSPIDLGEVQVNASSLGALDLYGFDSTPKAQWKLVNEGSSVVMEVGGGVRVSGGGLPSSYRTTQLHFHWGSESTNGSEHTILQHRFPMEMHIVNIKSSHPNLTAALQDPTGLAILAVFIDLVHVDNEHFQPISDALQFVMYKGQVKSIKPFPLLHLLPQSNLTQYYRYHGSLTTPPCSQAVVWTVYEVPIYISWAQLEPFITMIYKTQEDTESKALLLNNFRPVHPTYSNVLASEGAQLLMASSSRAGPVLQVLLLCGLRGLVHAIAP
ncbi:carbonic anhydrase 15 [Brachyhypopomus gauderio]|uniref:carbonic anhydrase 15 n=1 Tax=Brachyhypopomus gauderio TaxID=698409 RepID=UPI0040437B58